jgi:DNA-directed RNA polymerase sigma subunit (sigma70/sigma32)
MSASGDGVGASLGDMLAGDAPLPDAGCDTIDRKRMIARLMSAAGLSARERDVLRRRFGPREEVLDAIADDYGLTRERIRQIEAGALSKLRAAAERLGVEDET